MATNFCKRSIKESSFNYEPALKLLGIIEEMIPKVDLSKTLMADVNGMYADCKFHQGNEKIRALQQTLQYCDYAFSRFPGNDEILKMRIKINEEIKKLV